MTPLRDVVALDDLDHPGFIDACRGRLAESGALVVPGFLRPDAMATVIDHQSLRCHAGAFFAASTHNVYLSPPDPQLDSGHPFNRQVVSSKGLIADDQIPAESPLRTLYHAPEFRAPTGDITRILVVFAYNSEPGIALSRSALQTFYGRTS